VEQMTWVWVRRQAPRGRVGGGCRGACRRAHARVICARQGGRSPPPHRPATGLSPSGFKRRLPLPAPLALSPRGQSSSLAAPPHHERSLYTGGVEQMTWVWVRRQAPRGRVGAVVAEPAGGPMPASSARGREEDRRHPTLASGAGRVPPASSADYPSPHPWRSAIGTRPNSAGYPTPHEEHSQVSNTSRSRRMSVSTVKGFSR